MNMDTEEVEDTPAPQPPQQVFVSKEDRLEGENLHLKAVILNGQILELQRAIEEKALEQANLHKQLEMHKLNLENKYDINLTTHFIRQTDGAVLVRASQQQGLAGLMGKFGNGGVQK
jgi:hypothetical protein